jgi:hypothetical protein
MSATDTTKRALSASSSAETPDSKRANIAEEPPAWAIEMQSVLMSEIFKVQNSTNATLITVNDLKHDLRKVVADVEGIDSRLEALENRVMLAEEKCEALQGENKILHDRCDKIVDTACRDTLTIHGIARIPGKESWDDTKHCLSEWLATNSSSSPQQWFDKITRAHRGKPSSNVMHVLFKDWTHLQEVLELFRLAKGKINHVYALEKFSINTQERRNLAQKEREKERGLWPGSKLWIKYPATLMCQRVGEKGYKAIAHF